MGLIVVTVLFIAGGFDVYNRKRSKRSALFVEMILGLVAGAMVVDLMVHFHY